MENIYSGFSLTLALFFIFLLFLTSVLLLIKQRSQNPTSSPKLPPGPWKLPLLGNLHLLVGSVPHWRVFGALAKIYGPIMHLQLGGISVVVVSSPQLAKEALKTRDVEIADRPETFAGKTVFYDQKDVVFAPYGEYWRQMRKLCVTELLSNKKVKSFAPIRDQVVEELVSSIRSSLGSPFNLSEAVFLLSIESTSRAVFGQRIEGGAELMPLLKHQIDCLGKPLVSDLLPSLWLLDVFSLTKRNIQRMQKQIDCVMDNVIKVHKNKKMLGGNESRGDENILDVLIRLQRKGDPEFEVSDTSIKAIVFEMFAAGTDTSSPIVEWALSEMLKNPRIMEKAQAEVRLVVGENTIVDQSHCERLDYLKMVIKETLRLHPSAPVLLPRLCREVCEIDGYTIPLKTQVVVNAWAIGRDPSVWDDAESFKPERFENSSITFTGNNYEFIPFGAGRRICPGISFGLAFIEIVLANLLYHFDWGLPEGIEPNYLDMEESFCLVPRRKEPLYAIPASPKFV